MNKFQFWGVPPRIFSVVLLHPHDCFVTTDLYFLIPHLFHPAPQILFPLTTFSLFSASVLFVCFVL